MSKRVVMVTGAARGLGAAIAERFHAAGYLVAIADIAESQASKLASMLSADGSSACAIALDVTSKAAFGAAREALLARWRRIDVLVNNAGMSKVTPIMDITAEQFDHVINVNLRSVLFWMSGIRTVLRRLGHRANCQYRITRWTEWWLGNWCSLCRGERRRAHVNQSICPRPRVVRRHCQCHLTGPDGLADSLRECSRRQARCSDCKYPSRPIGFTRNVADMALLLASEQAYFANGACWDLNGGLFMR